MNSASELRLASAKQHSPIKSLITSYHHEQIDYLCSPSRSMFSPLQQAIALYAISGKWSPIIIVCTINVQRISSAHRQFSSRLMCWILRASHFLLCMSLFRGEREGAPEPLCARRVNYYAIRRRNMMRPRRWRRAQQKDFFKWWNYGAFCSIFHSLRRIANHIVCHYKSLSHYADV